MLHTLKFKHAILTLATFCLGLWALSVIAQIGDLYDRRFSWIALAACIAAIFISQTLRPPSKTSMLYVFTVLILINTSGLRPLNTDNSFIYILLITLMLTSISLWFAFLKHELASNANSGIVALGFAIIACPFLLAQFNHPATIAWISTIAILICFTLSNKKQNISSFFAMGLAILLSAFLIYYPDASTHFTKPDTPQINKISLPDSLYEMSTTINNNEKIAVLDVNNTNLISQLKQIPNNKQLTRIQRPAYSFSNTQNKNPPSTISWGKLINSKNQFDKIYLTLPEVKPTTKHNTSALANYLYSGNAIKQLLDSLNNEGIIVILSKTDLHLQKILLQSWQTLIQYSATNSIKHIFGFQSISMGDENKGTNSFQYMLLIKKTEPTKAFFKKTISLSKEIQGASMEKGFIFTSILGKNLKTSRHYKHLFSKKNIKYSLAYFEQLQSKKHSMLIDLRPTTAKRPSYSSLIKDLHPHVKWLAVFILLGIVCLLLIPASSVRHLKHTNNEKFPPVPVYLSYFVMLGIISSTCIYALLMIASIVDNTLSLSIPITAIGLLAGIMIGKKTNINSILIALVFNLVLVISCAFSIYNIDSFIVITNSAVQLSALLFVFSFFTGLSAYLLFNYGSINTSTDIPELYKWIFSITGIAILMGVTLSTWVAKHHGLDSLLNITIISTLLLFLIIFWLSLKKPNIKLQ